MADAEKIQKKDQHVKPSNFNEYINEEEIERKRYQRFFSTIIGEWNQHFYPKIGVWPGEIYAFAWKIVQTVAHTVKRLFSKCYND